MDSTKYFFKSHLYNPFKELPEDMDIKDKENIYKKIISMSVVAVGQGLCRMKIFVIQLPSTVQAIREYYINGDNKNYSEFNESLCSVLDSITAAAGRGTNPEFLLSSSKTLLQIAEEHQKFLNMLLVLPERFEMKGSYERLLELQYTYDICVGKMKLSPKDVSARLYSMVSAGQRRDLRKLWALFRKDFFTEKYEIIRSLLFQQNPTSFNSTEISRILSLLVVFHPLTGETCDPLVSTYATILLKKLTKQLEEIINDPDKSFTPELESKYSNCLNRLVLYKNVFPERKKECAEKYFPSLIEPEEDDEEDNEGDCCETETVPNETTNTPKPVCNEPIIHICGK